MFNGTPARFADLRLQAAARGAFKEPGAKDRVVHLSDVARLPIPLTD
jgi:hypothetical protein